MAEWIRQILVKFHVITHCEPTDKAEMISKLGVLIFFISGASFAILLSVIPNLGALFGVKQLGWGREAVGPSSLSINRVNSGRKHPLFCNPSSVLQEEAVSVLTLSNSAVIPDKAELNNKSSRKHKESGMTHFQIITSWSTG